MASDRSLRQRLRSTVLEATTPSGKLYSVLIFGAILLSVLALLLEPDPLGNSALRQTNVLWIDVAQNSVWLCLRPTSFCTCSWWSNRGDICSAVTG